MFKVVEHNAYDPVNYCCIVDRCDLNKYLHSDGRIFNTPEYWPTREQAQDVLDKFYPKPKHVWEHGDVFEAGYPRNFDVMLYVALKFQKPYVIYLNRTHRAQAPVENYLINAKFLFNIGVERKFNGNTETKFT